MLGGSRRLKALSLKSLPAAKVCTVCKRFDFGSPTVQIKDGFKSLRSRARHCEFCKIRWNIGYDSFSTTDPYIVFKKVAPNLELEGRHPPVLSIYRGSGVKASTSDSNRNLQIGFPRLPEAGSTEHFQILSHWLLECDRNHTSCALPDSTSPRLPTRLIDVGNKGSSVVKLYDTQESDNLQYLALSHPWGQQRSTHFCTVPNTLQRHKEGIRFDRLPLTFKDAVTVTRNLGHRYLWIDSICIIQGPEGDFSTEAKRMEDVFSHAYCVLAASSASGQHDGFLKTRQIRKHVTIVQGHGAPVFISEFMDNFQKHVLDSYLNTRGWVPQERALARRTIYFAGMQTYWECGQGVRCETMVKMTNKLASFLGDPKFPQVATELSQGGKIRVYQDFYTQYSRLGLSRHQDRPIAIAGLEKRLLSIFGGCGGFGTFDHDKPGVLRRSLLWHRAENVPTLSLISFCEPNFSASKVSSPPSWSWMAYHGSINYLDIPFDRVEWETKDIISPWAKEPLAASDDSNPELAKPQGLRVVAREFDEKAAATSKDANLILDIPAQTQSPGQVLKCVVFGRLNDDNTEEEDRIHFVLLVKSRSLEQEHDPHEYARAGVGYLPRRLITLTERGVEGKVF